MQRQKTSALRAHLCRSVTRTPAPLETDYTTTTMAVTPEEQALAQVRRGARGRSRHRVGAPTAPPPSPWCRAHPLQPLAPEEVTLEAWYMDDDLDADQRLPHR